MVGRSWTPGEIEKLEQLYPNKHALEVAQVLKRSTNSVLAKATRLGVEKSERFLANTAYSCGKRLALHQCHKLWTDRDRTRLAAIYPIKANCELASVFHCSEKAVRDQAHLMGVKKSISGSLAQRLGREGEAKAKEILVQQGFRILEIGRNRGGRIGSDAYDYIVQPPEGTPLALNVKYARHSLHIMPNNLRRLFRLGLPVAFLLITDYGTFWADVRKIL